MQSIVRIIIVIAIIVGGAVGAMMYRKDQQSSDGGNQSADNQALILQASEIPNSTPPVRVLGPVKSLPKSERLIAPNIIVDNNRTATKVTIPSTQRYSVTGSSVNGPSVNGPSKAPKMLNTFGDNIPTDISAETNQYRQPNPKIVSSRIRDLEVDEENDPTTNLFSKLHKVEDGDTLEIIAMNYLGNRKRAMEIYQLNRDLLPSPNVLPIGAELRLPSRTAPVVKNPVRKDKDSHLHKLDLNPLRP